LLCVQKQFHQITYKIAVMDGSLEFINADLAQAADIAALINVAFRSEPSGQTWLTDDQDKRTDMLSVGNVRETLSSPATPILVGTLANSPKLIAVCLLKAPGTCQKTTGAKSWLSMLAIDPSHHQRGYGAATLKAAEAFAIERWDAKRMELNVVNTRVELRAWYEKNGYRATGQIMEFPYGNHRDGLLADALELLVLGKDI
jgi:GNAT superfamily N-acetyltransferase